MECTRTDLRQIPAITAKNGWPFRKGSSRSYSQGRRCPARLRPGVFSLIQPPGGLTATLRPATEMISQH
jgi:hypothetical protein